MLQEVFYEFQIKASLSAIKSGRSEFHYSFKRIENVPIARNDDRVRCVMLNSSEIRPKFKKNHIKKIYTYDPIEKHIRTCSDDKK